jgi:16S rRNA (cytidine1402-2'-O)-methyltransferase
MTNGKLILIPMVIADDTQPEVIPEQTRKVLPSITHFLAENVRTARRFLSSLKVYDSIEALSFQLLDKDTPYDSLAAFFEPVRNGHSLGVLSESGCPGVADPGALAVRFAHENGIQVVPLVGPSSLLMALMASGLNGQKFAFHGYVPIKTQDASALIKALEKESRQKNQTQLFIETPYRNNPLMEILLKTLDEKTDLCIALDLTSSAESIQTHKVGHWKKLKPNFPKAPAVFLFLAH